MKISRSFGLAVCTLVTGFLAAAPAMAGVAPAAAPVAREAGLPGPVLPPGPSIGANPTSQNTRWSGYVEDDGAGNDTRVSGYFYIPTSVNCTKAVPDANLYEWLGIDGWQNKTVEQTGVQAFCQNGITVYSAWYEMYPIQPSVVYLNCPVSAGNEMYASVTDIGSHTYSFVLKDLATGTSCSIPNQTNPNAKDATADAIVEGPVVSTTLNLFQFSPPIQFYTVLVDGTPIGDSDPVQITLVDTSNPPKAEDSVSALNPAGKAFTVSWLRGD